MAFEVRYKKPTDLVVFKELEKEGCNSCSDAYEEVDDYEKDIGCTGNLKPEGCRIHYGSDRPTGKGKKETCYVFMFIKRS